MLFSAGVTDTGSSRSASGSSEGSDKDKQARNFKFCSEKLSETAETFVDITEVEVMQEVEEEDGPKRPRTKHDYKVNKLTWYSHNCLPVALQGSTLQVSNSQREGRREGDRGREGRE